MEISEEKILVFDADVLIHFIQGECFSDLRLIYPKNQKVVLQKVYEELQIHSKSKTMLDSAIHTFKFLKLINFPLNPEMMKEYAHLTSPLMDLGKGESACLSYCKFTKDVIVSSNLKDVLNYCNTHLLKHLTTLDLVLWAFENNVWSEAQCDTFIQALIQKGARIPNVTIAQYKTSKKGN